jgi:hypothetical protein
MKTIALLIYVLWFPCTFISQTNSSPCVIAYSEDEEAVVYRDSSHCSEIYISEIPPVEVAKAPLNLRFAKGTYTFKKITGLMMYQGYDVFIEDALTGQVFDLNKSESFTFHVNRCIADRFVMYVKKSPKLTAGGN